MIEVHARLGGDVNTFHLLAVDSRGQGYDRLQICRGKDGDSKIAETEVGQWSDWAIEPFEIDGRKQEASIRFKLMELTPTGKI